MMSGIRFMAIFEVRRVEYHDRAVRFESERISLAYYALGGREDFSQCQEK